MQPLEGLAVALPTKGDVGAACTACDVQPAASPRPPALPVQLFPKACQGPPSTPHTHHTHPTPPRYCAARMAAQGTEQHLPPDMLLGLGLGEADSRGEADGGSQAAARSSALPLAPPAGSSAPGRLLSRVLS